MAFKYEGCVSMFGFTCEYVCVTGEGPVLTGFWSIKVGKQLIIFVASDKIRAFRWKLEFWESSVCHLYHDSLPVPKDFSCEVGDINNWIFSVSYDEICQHLKELIMQWANIF